MINRSLLETAGISGGPIVDQIQVNGKTDTGNEAGNQGAKSRSNGISSGGMVGQNSERWLQGHCTLGVGDAKAEANQLVDEGM